MSLPLVSFYILPQTTQDDRELFACRLVEKAFKHGMTVHLLTDSFDACERLDNLLWTFKPESFLPHAIEMSTGKSAPITIGIDFPIAKTVDLAINLSCQMVDKFENLSRISEIVVQEASALEQSRQRYAAYKQLGCRIETHKL